MPTATNVDSPESIRTHPKPDCLLCGRPGQALYQGLDDLPWGVPGCFGFRQCPDPDCRLIWMDPAPIKEDLFKAYAVYFTHARPPEGGRLRRVAEAVRRGYLRSRLGH